LRVNETVGEWAENITTQPLKVKVAHSLLSTDTFATLSEKMSDMFLVICLALALSACGGTEPQGEILEEDEFIDVYIGLLEAGVEPSKANADSLASDNVRRILERFGTDEDEFRATVRFYNEDPERWNACFERVIRRLETKGVKKE